MLVRKATGGGALYPRPDALLPLIFAREKGEESDPAERLAASRRAVPRGW